MLSEPQTKYDRMRSYAPPHQVFAQTMADAAKFLVLFSSFNPKSLAEAGDISGLASIAGSYLRSLNEPRSKAQYTELVTEMGNLYTKNVARDITGPVLQDLHEGLLNLEAIADLETRGAA